MPSVDALLARKILDSRGDATVEVDVVVGRVRGRAAAPRGASTGTHEAQAFPTGGVDAALETFRRDVAPRLKGHDVTDQAGIDRLLREIDGTRNFARIGGNVAVAVSFAAAKAAAAHAGVRLYRYLGGTLGSAMPLPFGNVIGGGRHAVGGTTFQEFLVVSRGPTVLANVLANARVHRRVRDALAKRFPGEPLGRGDEAAWIARLDDEGALALLVDACRAVASEAGFPVRPALDLAASEFFRHGAYGYRDRTLSPEKQLEFLERLVTEYGVFSLEDPLDQEDFEGFARLTEAVGSRCKVIGDDLFATDAERLRKGIGMRAANAILIKPNQIGTLSETRTAVDLAHKAGYATVVSHRSGETTDDTIAHLAVAFGSLGIKAGAVGGERTAKLNELIRIEEELRGGA
ncbi:MAG: phosphopyruvate hydratase [Methanobacteriota archaeon]